MGIKLLIHIGYPKTATTTLQDGLFVTLHNKGLINYLGRSRASDSDYFEQAGVFSRSLFKDHKLGTNDLHLLPDRVNILSEETLTFPTFYKEKQWNRNLVDSVDFPAAMQGKLRDKVDDVEILVTIRNQQELIYSLFITKYRMFLNDEEGNLSHRFLFNVDGTFKKELFTIYDYSKVLKKYTEIFGMDKTHILLFEDFKANKNFFVQQLSEIIDIDSNIIEPLLSGVHLRKKKEAGSGYKREYKELTKTGQLINKIEDSVFKLNSLSKLKERYNSNKYVSHVKNRFLTYKQVHVIPKLTSNQKQVIFDEFKESNRKLATGFGLDKEKLKSYNYI